MSPLERTATLAVAAGCGAYLLLACFITVGRMAGVLASRETDIGHPVTRDAAIMTRRWVGGALLGLVPSICVRLQAGQWPWALFGFDAGVSGGAGVASLALLAAFLPAVATFARRPQSWQRYPQVRQLTWTPLLLAANTLSWLAYITGYELWFRGVLLFALAAVAPAPLAVTIMAALYAFAHFPSGRDEVLASVVTGVLFGVIVLRTGSILPALVAHLVIAQTNDVASVVFDPSRRFAPTAET